MSPSTERRPPAEAGLHAERLRRFAAAGLYLVTSEAVSAGRSTVDIVTAALAGGCRLIQLREKDMPMPAFLRLAERVRRLTAEAGALLIVNDRLDAALACGADGVHLGREDLPVSAARRVAPDLLIGASTHSVEEVETVQREGASYLNIGPLFPTGTKKWTAEFLGMEGLARLAPHAAIPFSVMGGIKRRHVLELCRLGARTIAVVTAITASANPEHATRGLLADIRAAREGNDPDCFARGKPIY